jgi:hypothetical protein
MEPSLNWQCGNCDNVVPQVATTPTLIPAVRMGKCWKCGKRTTFRPVQGAVTVATPPKPRNRTQPEGLLPAGPTEPNLAAGLREKEVGMRGAEFAETPSGWVEQADAAIARHAATGRPFTSDVIVAEVGMPPHYNAVGARMNAAARKGIIRKAGYTQGARPSAHARTVAVWQGAE